MADNIPISLSSSGPDSLSASRGLRTRQRAPESNAPGASDRAPGAFARPTSIGRGGSMLVGRPGRTAQGPNLEPLHATPRATGRTQTTPLERTLPAQTIALAWANAREKAGRLGEEWTEHDRAVWAVMDAVQALAADRGVSRMQLAARLGIKHSTLESRARPETGRLWTVREIGRMLLGDALPEDVRRHGLAAFLSLAGHVLVDQGDGFVGTGVDRSPAMTQLAEISAATGELARELLDSRQPDSPAGTGQSRRELEAALAKARVAQAEIAQLIEAFEAGLGATA